MQDKTVNEKLIMNGYRLTRQRRAVLEVMMDNPGQHLSAEDVLIQSRARIGNIGIATVYRTLERLASIGILYKNMFDEGKSRYEICDTGLHHHYHILCIGCGKIAELEDEMLKTLETSLEERGYRIVNHDVKVFAYCPACAQEHK